LAVDDTGAGFASFSHILSLGPDIIKLDRAFVSGLDASADRRRMASVILRLSEAIGAEIIAEGIETEGEGAVLRDLGYEVGQGFLFARPLDVSGVEEFFETAGSTRERTPATH